MKSKAKSSRVTDRYAMIEPLEARIAPAAVVALTNTIPANAKFVTFTSNGAGAAAGGLLLKAGEVRVVTPDGQEHYFFVGGGALEVQPHKVTVLADTALRAKDLDEAAALAAKQRVEAALKDKTDLTSEAELLAELTRFSEQLKMIERLRKQRG